MGGSGWSGPGGGWVEVVGVKGWVGSCGGVQGMGVEGWCGPGHEWIGGGGCLVGGWVGVVGIQGWMGKVVGVKGWMGRGGGGQRVGGKGMVVSRE